MRGRNRIGRHHKKKSASEKRDGERTKERKVVSRGRTAIIFLTDSPVCLTLIC
jgi:hypothetical protein